MGDQLHMPPAHVVPFRFVDLFAGIGGFHLAMTRLGGTCVFAAEIDSHARKTYAHNFAKHSPQLFEQGRFYQDVRTLCPENLPDFELLCAGFPCQPFSQAGQKRGFADTHQSERGNLFFALADIIAAKHPQAFFLENVRGIVNHDHGNTFATIREILTQELGYSFYYQIVKASDFGLPQLRPRVFMVGFREDILGDFAFPAPQPLQLTMSDVWGGVCSRDVGYTLRVGGRGSKIDDRHNWDHYWVDGRVRKLMPEQAKKMQGFPDDFEFPVANSQAMKQLGNSVAVNAVQACGQAVVAYWQRLHEAKHNDDNKAWSVSDKKNKGEWTELYSLLKVLNDKKLALADKHMQPNGQELLVSKVSTLNLPNAYYWGENDTVRIENKATGMVQTLGVQEFLTPQVLADLAQLIKNQGGASFALPSFHAISSRLGISLIKGGHAKQKADIVLDVSDGQLLYPDKGFGIKSYLGNKPTLLNASGNTNFIYQVHGLSAKFLHEINAINTRHKLKDRLHAIAAQGGSLKFDRVERHTMAYNLDLVDSAMPELMALMLLEFYQNRHARLEDNLYHVAASYGDRFSTDLPGLRAKIKRLLLAILLGFFPGSQWDGDYAAQGVIVVKQDGSQVAYHITDLATLAAYLYEQVRFDTPSTTRHRYGLLVSENGRLWFKLNWQWRF